MREKLIKIGASDTGRFLNTGNTLFAAEPLLRPLGNHFRNRAFDLRSVKRLCISKPLSPQQRLDDLVDRDLDPKDHPATAKTRPIS